MKHRHASFARLTKLSIACTAVAVGYIIYRGIAILGPNGLSSFVTPNHSAIRVGCENSDSHEGQPEHKTASKSPSPGFQAFLAKQPSVSANLLQNTSLASLDTISRAPVHYYRTVKKKDFSYHLYYDEANQPYLHVTSDSKTESGAWVTDMTPLQPSTTYAYSFSFRASTTATVTAEYITAGKHTYEVAAHLHAADSWQTFTHYVDNNRGASAFRFIITLDKAGQLDTRDFAVHQIANAQLGKGIVSVTFDDGWQSVADKALPLLQKYNIRTTQYIITEASEKGVAGYMNDKTIKTFRSQGHEIASHSQLHCDQTGLNQEELAQSALRSKEQLEQQGLSPITSFAYPYGAYSERTQKVFTQNYQFIRTSDEGYNDRYFDTQRLKSFAVHSTTSPQDIKAMLDHAKKDKQWLILVYHRVDEHGDYNVTAQDLDAQLHFIRDSGLSILPISEAATSIR